MTASYNLLGGQSIYSCFIGDKNQVFFTGRQTFAAVIVAPKGGYLSQEVRSSTAELLATTTDHVSQKVRPSPGVFVETDQAS